MESHRQIEEQASRLLAKRDTGAWSESDQAQLESWMGETTAHRVAVLRLEAAWDEARRLKAAAAGLRPGMVPPRGAWRQTPFFDQGNEGVGRGPVPLGLRKWWLPSANGRWRARALAAAAAILLAVIGGYFLLTTSVLNRGRFVTAVGQVASVSLPDGSTMTLNTDSEVRLRYDRNERRVDLERGEAFFDDVKDPHRPFVVHVGDKRVVAVGTAFSVGRDNSDVRVVVIQGQVRLEDSRVDSMRTAQVEGEEALRGGGREPHAAVTAVLLKPGAVARATGSDFLVQNMSLAQAEQDLSWRSGYLTFQDTTLADAVDQLNRYNSHKIVITDSTVAAIRISGTFRPTDYAAFVHLLQKAYSIHAATTEGETSLRK